MIPRVLLDSLVYPGLPTEGQVIKLETLDIKGDTSTVLDGLPPTSDLHFLL